MSRKKQQRLVDLMYDLALTLKDNRGWLGNASYEEITDWVTKQLKAAGFNTVPMGLSWGVLTDGEDKLQEAG